MENNKNKHIYLLIGPKGSGKSLIGTLFEKHFNIKFYRVENWVLEIKRDWDVIDEEYIKIGLFELIDAFQKILERIPEDHKVEMTADEISVKDKITQIIDILEDKKSITFLELFSDNPDKKEIIVTFLAVLEMVKLTLIRIVQHVQTGVMRIFYI
mgnify:CR=1 FL=1